MKGKKFLFFLVGGLLIIAWAAQHQWRVKPLPFSPSFEIERVERIQLGKASPASSPQSPQLVTLVKAKQPDASNWRIPDLSNARADERKIERLLKELRLSKGELVGRDPSLFPNFGLRNEEAFQLSLFDGNWTPLFTLLIGAKKEGAQTFVREPGSNGVYRVKGDLLEAMGVQGDPTRENVGQDFWVKMEKEP